MLGVGCSCCGWCPLRPPSLRLSGTERPAGPYAPGRRTGIRPNRDSNRGLSPVNQASYRSAARAESARHNFFYYINPTSSRARYVPIMQHRTESYRNPSDNIGHCSGKGCYTFVTLSPLKLPEGTQHAHGAAKLTILLLWLVSVSLVFYNNFGFFRAWPIAHRRHMLA